jgi:hypothetical protein
MMEIYIMRKLAAILAVAGLLITGLVVLKTQFHPVYGNCIGDTEGEVISCQLIRYERNN